eukprot:1156081-Pelagomonas_calceolata.AAC.20
MSDSTCVAVQKDMRAKLRTDQQMIHTANAHDTGSSCVLMTSPACLPHVWRSQPAHKGKPFNQRAVEPCCREVGAPNNQGCQCPIIRNMVTERYNTASRRILKAISKGSHGPNLVHVDVGSADRLARHELHITEQEVSNRIIHPYLFYPRYPDQASRNSGCPDAILVTPCPANQNIPLYPPSR